jgi:hypothetical protein
MIVVALLATLVLHALGYGLVTLGNTEAIIATNTRDASALLHAAEAAAECAVADTLRAGPLTDLLSGVATSRFVDGTTTPTLASGETLDLGNVTSVLQVASDSAIGRGADNPRWRLFLSSPLSRISRSAAPTEYVVAWVADDAAEQDGDPASDSNGVIVVRAQAFSRLGVHRVVEVVVADRNLRRSVLSWREIR